MVETLQNKRAQKNYHTSISCAPLNLFLDGVWFHLEDRRSLLNVLETTGGEKVAELVHDGDLATEIDR